VARRLAKSLTHHISNAAETWQRRLAAERVSEAWSREKRDTIDVPGLTPQSERILDQLDKVAYPDRPAFIAQICETPEGRQAFKEAEIIVAALERRFGIADFLRRDAAIDRLGHEIVGNLDRVKSIAKVVERAELARLSQRQELKRSLTKGLGARNVSRRI